MDKNPVMPGDRCQITSSLYSRTVYTEDLWQTEQRQFIEQQRQLIGKQKYLLKSLINNSKKEDEKNLQLESTFSKGLKKVCLEQQALLDKQKDLNDQNQKNEFYSQFKQSFDKQTDIFTKQLENFNNIINSTDNQTNALASLKEQEKILGEQEALLNSMGKFHGQVGIVTYNPTTKTIEEQILFTGEPSDDFLEAREMARYAYLTMASKEIANEARPTADYMAGDDQWLEANKKLKAASAELRQLNPQEDNTQILQKIEKNKTTMEQREKVFRDKIIKKLAPKKTGLLSAGENLKSNPIQPPSMLSVAMDIFLGEDEKKAAATLGARICDMEDDIILRALMTSDYYKNKHITSLDVTRIACDPCHLSEKFKETLGTWAQKTRYTKETYIAAIMWGLDGKNMTTWPKESHWGFYDELKSDEDEKEEKCFYKTTDHDQGEIVIDPFWREIGTDFVQETQDMLKSKGNQIDYKKIEDIKIKFAKGEGTKELAEDLFNLCTKVWEGQGVKLKESNSDKYKIWVRESSWGRAQTLDLTSNDIKNGGYPNRTLYVSSNMAALAKEAQALYEPLYKLMKILESMERRQKEEGLTVEPNKIMELYKTEIEKVVGLKDKIANKSLKEIKDILMEHLKPTNDNILENSLVN